MSWLAEKIDQMLKLFLRNLDSHQAPPHGDRLHLAPHWVLASGCRALCFDSAAAVHTFGLIQLISRSVFHKLETFYLINVGTDAKIN